MGNKRILPKGWIETTLGALCLKPQYGWTSKSSSRKGNIRYLRTTDISKDFINWDNVPFCLTEPDNLEKYFLEKDDILISRAGSIGISKRIEGIDRVAVFASYLIRLKPVIVSAKFIEYYLQSPFYWQIIASKSSGIAVQNINASKIANITIPLPPLNEQKHIVKRLDELMIDVDNIQGHLSKIPFILQIFSKIILEYAFSGKLTSKWREEHLTTTKDKISNNKQEMSKIPIPNSWSYLCIEDVQTFIGSGLTPRGGKNVYTDTGIRFLRSQNVYSDGLKLNNIAYIPNEIHNKMKRTHIKDGDVLLNITGASIGRCTYIPDGFGAANVNQHVCIIRTNDKVLPAFLSNFLNSAYGQNMISSMQQGVTRQALNLSQIKSILIPLPTIDEQKEIVRIIEELLNFAKKIMAQYKNAQNHADVLPKIILNRAFCGELVSQNNNDEPANKLIEQIQKEKYILEAEMKIKSKKNNHSGGNMGKRYKETNLIDIIRNNKMGITPETLLEESKYTNSEIDKFYMELKAITEEIKEIRVDNKIDEWPKKESVLIALKKR